MVRYILSALLLMLALVPASIQAQEQRCFPETGQCISGRIREFWEQNGGLPVFGFPTTDQHEELVEGRPFQVQWFERNRLELHPENARPYDVLLGRLGADRLAQQGRPDWQNFPKDKQPGNCLSFTTGHSVCGAILRAWRASGLEFDGRPGTSETESLALFGLPISSPALEVQENQVYMVQWFERARFELHPENQPPYDVLLGLLGNEIRQANQATPLSNGSEIDGLTVAGGRVFFSALDGDRNLELWTSDGTAAGTRLVKDILPGPEGSWPRHLADLNGTLLFAAQADASGNDTLWRSEGTTESTVQVLPAARLRQPWQITVVGDRAFFIGEDDTHGEELWITDGTAQGTHIVKDVYPGPRGIHAEQNMPMGYIQFTPTKVGQQVYFQAEAPGLGYGLWKSDGTAEGTQFVSGLNSSIGSPELWDMTSLNDTLLFIGRTGRLNYGLYRSDGTEAGTQLVYDFSYPSDPGTIRLYPLAGDLRTIGDHIYFTYSGALWKTDGTRAGTMQVTQFLTGAIGAIGGQAYFLSLSRPYGFDLVRAGTTQGEQVVATAAPTLYQPSGKLASADGRLFIAVNGSGGRAELWVSDGAAQGTRPVLALKGRVFGQADLADGLRTTVALGQRLVFAADDGIHGGELWISDGTPAGTMMLKDINLR
jgi:ELWxxDGT repeat protein